MRNVLTPTYTLASYHPSVYIRSLLKLAFKILRVITPAEE